ncbi:MAG: hypothetical protein GXP45_02355 [bacterium]|nr:hypothetical protein [bacterium]
MLLQTLKITEETGELSEQIIGALGGQRLSKSHKISEDRLEKEIADVIFATVRLARLLKIDIEKLLEIRKEELTQRFNAE